MKQRLSWAARSRRPAELAGADIGGGGGQKSGQISEQIQVIKKECKGIGIDISAYSSPRGERREGERTLVCIKSAKVMSPFCI